MFKKLIVTAVRFSARYPWPVLAVVIMLSLGSACFVADRFALNTDITTFFSPNLPWRQREIAYIKAFPKQDTAITVVVDGPTPELAEEAAENLTQRLRREHSIIQGAR